jgi:peptidoglycan/xylan/chitin deacetylase (PgdA/CDA1 family)
MKRAMLNLMVAAGAFAPFRIANRSKALILMYHRFSENDDGVSTSARAFGEQLEYLKAHYQLVPLSQIAEYIRSGTNLPPGLAAITIDDGFLDAYEVAFPLLRRYDAPATLFVVTDFLDRKTWVWTDKLRFLTLQSRAEEFESTINGRRLRFELQGRWSRLEAAGRVNEMLKKLPDDEKEGAIERIAATLNVSLPDLPTCEYTPLTWDQAREMDSSGVEIASHTLTHPILTLLDNERLRRELQDSRSRLEAMLGHEVRSFCYPNGNYDERVLREAERARYTCAVATVHGLNDQQSNPLALKRISADCDLAHFVQGTSGFEQVKNRLRGSRGNAALKRSRSVAGEI